MQQERVFLDTINPPLNATPAGWLAQKLQLGGLSAYRGREQYLPG